jgi:transposase
MANTVKRPGIKRGRKCKYTDSYKKQIATTVLGERLGIKEAAERFGIAHHQTISRWIKQFYDEIVETNVIESMITPSAARPDPFNEVNIYEDKLRQAHLKISALETMIELAENTYKIAIRKNSGTKQQP